MDRKGKMVAKDSIFSIDCGGPYRSDRPRGQIGALNFEKWHGVAPHDQVTRLGGRQTALIAADSRARGATLGSPINLLGAKRQRLTIIHNRSKLPPNFSNSYRQLPITQNSLVDMAYFNEKKAAPKRGG